jgi:hypothetical protein
MAAAISTACVSRAKCPVSKKRTTAFGVSRLNASALRGRKQEVAVTDRSNRNSAVLVLLAPQPISAKTERNDWTLNLAASVRCRADR